MGSAELPPAHSADPPRYLGSYGSAGRSTALHQGAAPRRSLLLPFDYRDVEGAQGETDLGLVLLGGFLALFEGEDFDGGSR